MADALVICTIIGLIVCIFLTGDFGSRNYGIVAFAASTVVWGAYELTLLQLNPYPEIRADLVLIVPLRIASAVRLFKPR